MPQRQSLIDRLRMLYFQWTRNSALAVMQREEALARLRLAEGRNDPRRLVQHEFQVYSQNGEDGILREIFRRVASHSRFFVEIGVGDGLQNNTALLLADGWQGVWVEGSAANCRLIKQNFAAQLASGQLVLLESFVTVENIASLLAPHLPSTGIDVLSIDVDRNTYYVWESLGDLPARVAVIEYNPVFPADMLWKVEYDAAKWWNGTTYFGASLASLTELGSRHRYNLVACDVTGTNAFFIREEDCVDRFSEPFNAQNHYQPGRYYLQGRIHGQPRAIAD